MAIEMTKKLMAAQYDSCLTYFAFDPNNNNLFTADSLKRSLALDQKSIIDELGKDLKFKIIDRTQNTSISENVKTLTLQLSNHKYYGYIVITFDADVNKITSVKLTGRIEPILPPPDMSAILLFITGGIFALSIIVFTLFKISHSSLAKRSRYYLITCLLHVPTIVYHSDAGFDISWIPGIYFFRFYGHSNEYTQSGASFVVLYGLPIGAIISLYLIYKSKAKKSTGGLA